MANLLDRSVVYRGVRRHIVQTYGEETAARLWLEAGEALSRLQKEHPEITGDNRMMILPAAALLMVLRIHDPEGALPLLLSCGTQIGRRIGRIIHAVTSIPGLPALLWRHMPALMRKTSSPRAGYTRRIVSETKALVGVDILSCPLHDAAVSLGIPEAACIVCAMDKEYMSGFRHIRYTRTTSVAGGGPCCDYRLSFDPDKK